MPDIHPSSRGFGGDLKTFVNSTFENFKKNREKLLEPRWNRNREAFLGIMTGTWKAGEGEDWRSSTHVNVTRQKVFTGAMLVLDQELQGGEIPFSLIPIESLDNAVDTAPDAVKQDVDAAVEAQRSKIKEQLNDCQADQVLKKVVMSMALYGEAYAKYFIHDRLTTGWQPVQIQGIDTSRLNAQDLGWEPFSTTTAAPGVGYRSVWNIYRDLESASIREGSGLIDRDQISPYMLRSKDGQMFWLTEGIDNAISDSKKTKDGSSGQVPTDRESLPPSLRDVPARSKTIDFKECYLLAPRNKVEAFEAELAAQAMEAEYPDTEIPEPPMMAESEAIEGDNVGIAIGLAGDHVVFYKRMPRTEWPYYTAKWAEQIDEVGGIGEADMVHEAQKMLNGEVRAAEDGAKMASSPIGAVKERMLVEGKVPKSIRPGTLLRLNDDAPDIRAALSFTTVPDVTASLMPMIELAMRILEEDSMLPRSMQGLTQTSQRTAYEISTTLEKAGKFIGDVIRNLDQLVEAIITDFYNYNMADPDTDDGKGQFQIRALGFSSYQDRVVRVEKLIRWLQLIMANPLLGAEYNVADIADEIGKSLDANVDQYRKSDEQKAMEAEQNQNMSPAVALQLQALKVDIDKVVAETAKIQNDIQMDKGKLQIDQAGAMTKLAKEADGMRQARMNPPVPGQRKAQPPMQQQPPAEVPA